MHTGASDRRAYRGRADAGAGVCRCAMIDVKNISVQFVGVQFHIPYPYSASRDAFTETRIDVVPLPWTEPPRRETGTCFRCQCSCLFGHDGAVGLSLPSAMFPRRRPRTRSYRVKALDERICASPRTRGRRARLLSFRPYGKIIPARYPWHGIKNRTGGMNPSGNG